MTNTEKLVVGAALVGAVAAGAFVASRLAGDDDRPPIIVKGGSLYFDNGKENNAHRPRKNWKKDSATGEYAQDDAKNVKFFQVYFVGGTKNDGSACEPTTVTNFTIRFDHDANTTTMVRSYAVKIVNKEPTISGDGLSGEGSPRLTAEALNGAKTITSVDFDDWKCLTPTEVWIESGWKQN